MKIKVSFVIFNRSVSGLLKPSKVKKMKMEFFALFFLIKAGGSITVSTKSEGSASSSVADRNSYCTVNTLCYRKKRSG